MHWQSSSLSWVFLIPIFLPAVAVFTDEAYQVDYHHALIGVPQPHNTFFHRPSANSKASLLYSLSDRGVLGAINPKDGSIVWRQPLVHAESSEVRKGSQRTVAEGNTIFSSVRGVVQAWDAAEGRLVWEQVGTGESKGLDILDFGGSAKSIFALTAIRATAGTIRKLQADSGEVLWEFTDER
jgi:outer membrane protein assembly factor BamB